MSNAIEWPYQYGVPKASATIKGAPEHFKVDELLSFELTGEGEHVLLRIEKTGENTSFVANELARFCGVKTKDVSWAGLKDRHAVTQQWFSIHLPKHELDFAGFEKLYPSVKILKQTRHNKKLRPGDNSGNQFSIVLSNVSNVDDVEERLKKVIENGVPNYFGEQRFGRDRNNVTEAARWGRDNVRTRNQNKRSLYLSAARSWIFNQIVAERIKQNCFNSPVLGDLVQIGDELRLINEQNIGNVSSVQGVITAALAGDNALPTAQDALQLEQAQLDKEPDLMALIRGNRMRHDRRAVMLKPEKLEWQWQDNDLTLNFELESGCFATTIVRELALTTEPERHYPDATQGKNK
jgi:tRNA pseudouridine13 synthase